jgi:hypothetical protein
VGDTELVMTSTEQHASLHVVSGALTWPGVRVTWPEVSTVYTGKQVTLASGFSVQAYHRPRPGTWCQRTLQFSRADVVGAGLHPSQAFALSSHCEFLVHATARNRSNSVGPACLLGQS